MLFEAISLEDYGDVRYKDGKLDVAKNMLQKHFEIEDIADITGLPIETIKELKIQLCVSVQPT